ncbi:MAG: hypothetical protein ACHQAX_08795 [Gammaproteobacteria bacterium]
MFNASRYNVESYVHAYHACADYPKTSDLSLQTQALNLANHFQAKRNLPLAAKYLALAAMHCAERERHTDDRQKSLDVVLKDKNFECFFMHFGYSMFLGPIIADTTSKAIYVPPQSMIDVSAQALAQVLKTKPTIATLDVRNQHLTDLGATALAEVLRDHPGIKKVYVGGNQIGQEGEKALRAACSNIHLSFGEQHIKHDDRHAWRNRRI